MNFGEHSQKQCLTMSPRVFVKTVRGKMQDTKTCDWQAIHCQILSGNSAAQACHEANLGITVFWWHMVYNLRKNKTVSEAWDFNSLPSTCLWAQNQRAVCWGYQSTIFPVFPPATSLYRHRWRLQPPLPHILPLLPKKEDKKESAGAGEEHCILGGEMKY